MSVKREYKEETRTVTDSFLVSEKRYCDVCGKEITGPFWEVTTGHYDWGNDSTDSIEDKDCCSVECLSELFDEYKHVSTVKDGLYNTQYFHVDHARYEFVKGEVR